MRLFIAIDIDEKNKAALSGLQKQLISKADIRKSDAKWVRSEIIHLTLKFLGEVKDQRIARICDIVKDVVTRHRNFELDVESVGYFGGQKTRVLWIGAGSGRDNLLELQKDLEEQLASAGWPKEARKFSGHLTLCRIRNPQAGVKLAEISEDYKDFKLGTVPVDSVSVYQSQLTPTGPVYTLLGNYKLS